MVENRMTSNTPQILYHGTSAKDEFSKFIGDLVYLAEDVSEAKAFAESPIIGGSRGKGRQRIITVSPKKGSIQDISSVIDLAIEEDLDIDETIINETLKARKQGHRYIQFDHPSTIRDEPFKAIVSLYPSEDLSIQKKGPNK